MKMNLSFIIFASFLSFSSVFCTNYTYQMGERLFRDLFQGPYNKDVLPEKPVRVKHGIALLNLQDVDGDIVTVAIWERFVCKINP